MLESTQNIDLHPLLKISPTSLIICKPVCRAKASHVYMHHSHAKEHRPPYKIVVLQARLTSAKKGNCIYKPCPVALYSVVQSRYSILSHDVLRHCLSSNSSLENGERELRHLFHYYRNCKNTEYTSQGACLLRNR